MRQLCRQAREVCSWRKHEMTRFKTVEDMGGHVYKVAHCKRCDAQVAVCKNPPPNGIDIGGEAVAVNCLGSKRARVIADNETRKICGLLPREVPE